MTVLSVHQENSRQESLVRSMDGFLIESISHPSKSSSRSKDLVFLLVFSLSKPGTSQQGGRHDSHHMQHSLKRQRTLSGIQPVSYSFPISPIIGREKRTQIPTTLRRTLRSPSSEPRFISKPRSNPLAKIRDGG
jgi:hypothetical protein